MESEDLKNALVRVLQTVFVSPNCHDSNFEAANVVDGLYAIAYSISKLAKVLDKDEVLLRDN